MADVICDTSPLQYLHQVGLLHILPALATRVIIPPAVQEELEVGKGRGIDLPALAELNWLEVRLPQTAAAVPLVTDLGKGEIQVLMLALEDDEAVAVLDDGLARRVAEMLEIQYTGTLGLPAGRQRSRSDSGRQAGTGSAGCSALPPGCRYAECCFTVGRGTLTGIRKRR